MFLHRSSVAGLTFPSTKMIKGSRCPITKTNTIPPNIRLATAIPRTTYRTYSSMTRSPLSMNLQFFDLLGQKLDVEFKSNQGDITTLGSTKQIARAAYFEIFF